MTETNFSITSVSMSVDSLVLRSSIKPDLALKKLRKGTFLAALGIAPLFVGSLFLDNEWLAVWGMPLFFLSMGLIAWGMIPYRYLTRLEKKPNELILSDTHTLQFIHLGKKIWTLPLSAIEKAIYVEEGSCYGIGVVLKKPPAEKVTVHASGFQFERHRLAYQKKYHCDLFFPYFSRRAFETIQEYL